LPSARTAVACQIQPFVPSRPPEMVGLIRAATTIEKDCTCTGRMPSTPTPRRASSALIRAGLPTPALRGARRDDRLRPAAGGGVGEGFLDPGERERGADQTLDAKLR
jgi:hypothetical protein